MPKRTSMVTMLIVALLLSLAFAGGYGIGRLDGPGPVEAAQDGSGTWNSTMIWRPTLEETGLALAEWVNEIDASCNVDVDNITAINGNGPEGDVYAVAVTWAC